MNLFKQTFKTTSDFNTAVEMASEILGHYMFECYEHRHAEEEKRMAKNGVDKFYVHPTTGTIFYVFKWMNGRVEERVLNTVSVGSCGVSAGSLSVLIVKDDTIEMFFENACDKGDHKSRRKYMRELPESVVYSDSYTNNKVAA